MAKNQIQEERMRAYFIQATNEILRSEGLKDVSVRNIAKKAGYSYATLYNYFKDIKDLIFECVKDFQEECCDFITNEIKDQKNGLDRIKAIHLAYFKFFVQYPGIFELFYIEKTTDLVNKQPTIEMIDSFLATLTDNDWKIAISEGKIETEGAKILQEQLKFFIVGLLVSYINRRFEIEYAEIIKMVEQHLSYILEM